MDLSFVVIDDSELDCFIAKKIIEQSGKHLFIKTFKNAKPALEAIADKKIDDNGQNIIILLDLYMPLMDGFQFVEAFEKLPVDIQDKYKINVLSSSRNQNEITRLLNYNKVSSFIEKPLTLEKLLALFPQA